MNIPKLVLALLILSATSCDRTPADPSRPDAFALQLPLEPAADGALQRLTLPPEALVAMRRRDLGDVRVFDARGKVVPIARADQARASQHRSDVPVYPVVGPASALEGGDLSIRIEGNSVARVVTVDSGLPPGTRAGPPAAVLLDTRALREPANAIELDVEIPAGQPVALKLLASTDLNHWEPLAGKMLFRPADGSPLLGGASIPLPRVDLRDRYVGISWGGASGVRLKGATVVTSIVAPPARIAIATSAASLPDAHDLRFVLPSLPRLAAIRLTGAASDGVIPVKLFGRDQAEDPWTLLSATTLRPRGGANVLELDGPAMTSYRLEADRRTAGFSAPPRLELLLDPVELLIAPSGTLPYRLAVGQAAAPASFLTLAEIAPQPKPLKLADLPQATVAVPRGPPPVVALRAGAADGALEPRKLMLWAALLLGTLVLAFAAFRLLRMQQR